MLTLPRGRKVGPAIFDRRHLRLTQWMVGYWSPVLTGATGLQLLDLSGENNHGTLTNMDAPTDWVDSPYGKVIDFDGSNDFVNITANLSSVISSKVFTFAVWIRTSATNTNAYPFAAGNTASDTPYLGFRLDPSGNGQTQFFYRDSAGNFVIPGSGAAINNGQWNQLVAVANGSTLQVHVNGSAYGSASSISSLGAATITRVTIGALGRTTVIVHFAGQIAEACIWSDAMTRSEIQTLHALGPGGLGRRLRDDFLLYQTAIAYSLEASTASYTLTGQPIPLLYGRVLPADTGSLLLSNRTTSLLTSRLLNADQGSYAYSGTDAATLLGRLLDAGAAAYTLDSTAAGFLASRRISADTVAYLASGLDAGFLRSRVLEAGTGQYILVASPINITTGTGGAAPYYYLFLLGGSR